MLRASSYFAWAALAVAILLWGAAIAFAWQIMEEEKVRDSLLLQVQEEEAQQAGALKLRGLARETEEGRAKLEAIADHDIVELLDIVENVSRDLKIPLKVGETLTAGPSDASTPLRSASFLVEAQGTFTQVAHAIAFLESLPLPSSLTEIHLEELPASASARSKVLQWRVVARLNILTTAEL